VKQEWYEHTLSEINACAGKDKSNLIEKHIWKTAFIDLYLQRLLVEVRAGGYSSEVMANNCFEWRVADQLTQLWVSRIVSAMVKDTKQTNVSSMY